MSKQAPIKLIPRNVAALRRGQNPSVIARGVPGNPVSTRLESGIGNCFPGLECDLRNLERRFFPFLEVDFENPDINDSSITVASVDIGGVLAARARGRLSAAHAVAYETIAIGKWLVQTIKGDFGL